MIKKIIKTVIYALGIVLSLWIINTGITATNYRHPNPKKASTESVDTIANNPSTTDLTDYTFGADFYTETYNALYTINENLGLLQQSNDVDTQKILDAQQKNINQIGELAYDINNESLEIQQASLNRLGIVFIVIGAVIFLVYVEKIVNLYSFTLKKKEKVKDQENQITA